MIRLALTMLFAVALAITVSRALGWGSLGEMTFWERNVIALLFLVPAFVFRPPFLFAERVRKRPREEQHEQHHAAP